MDHVLVRETLIITYSLEETSATHQKRPQPAIRGLNTKHYPARPRLQKIAEETTFARRDLGYNITNMQISII